MSMRPDKLWILFEERPKEEVILNILNLYSQKNNLEIKIENNGKKIIPIIENKIFRFQYQLRGLKINDIKEINLLLVSGNTSFVDFLLYEKVEMPKDIDNLMDCVFGIEETKTDSGEARNTAAGQRATKFIILDHYAEKNSSETEKIMLYNNTEKQRENDTDSVRFIKSCMKTIGIKFIGDRSASYKVFKSINELIEDKNSMRQPPKGNTPIRITKLSKKISISGTLSKPKEKGNIGNDPNQGQLTIISKCLRKLGWTKEIELTDHCVKQEYINNSKGNKFIFSASIIDIKLENISLPRLEMPQNYWRYEMRGEKIATILLHTVCNYLKFKSIYENHAGAERGYIYDNNENIVTVAKKHNGKNINLPDYIFLDDEKKCIHICEGEMFQNYQKGIEQIDGFDLIINLYIKKYYRNYSIERSIILSNGESNSLSDKVLFQLNSNGKILYSNKLPSKIAQYINENHN